MSHKYRRKASRPIKIKQSTWGEHEKKLGRKNQIQNHQPKWNSDQLDSPSRLTRSPTWPANTSITCSYLVRYRPRKKGGRVARLRFQSKRKGKSSQVQKVSERAGTQELRQLSLDARLMLISYLFPLIRYCSNNVCTLWTR